MQLSTKLIISAAAISVISVNAVPQGRPVPEAKQAEITAEFEAAAAAIIPTCQANAAGVKAAYCCWRRDNGRGEDGNATLGDNSDQCYRDEDKQVDMHCHGTAWDANSSDADVLNTLSYIRNDDHRFQRGYVGQFKGQECGCAETMIAVTRADCTTTTGGDDFEACTNNNLQDEYNRLSGEDLDTVGNIDEGCLEGQDTFNVKPIQRKRITEKFEAVAAQFIPTCAANDAGVSAAYCCWRRDNGLGEDGNDALGDNSDRCGVKNQPDIHCHGTAWAAGTSDADVLNTLSYIRNDDHRFDRGYVGQFQGLECGCAEAMVAVTRADCTTTTSGDDFEACTNNNLQDEFNELSGQDLTSVGNISAACNDA